ncbi:MAG: hypothetical protein EOQ39_18710 [Mesorhizobium sp.]|uniref:hypothetical protein n=1 Tax=Mesorhizobium sp. TaxID=1871066 RepID=UPI000FE75F1A|nr:hypothetical protein [Mesorhizobium sp.]RWB08797.1 MAG: hypothetical protein EOQ37_04630 [Mesorhizobium sp.]RWB13552.1 MAG: hypothetical protein EOQ39_18710 [Mesorhizobium sp.]
MLKSFSDLKAAMPRAPMVLQDMTQPHMRAQHPGARRVYTRPSPFDPHALYMSEGSVNWARTRPDLDEHRPPEPIFKDRVPREAPQHLRPRAQSIQRRNEKRLYAPVNGHSEGMSVVIADKLTGQVLARCVGSYQHLVGEAIKLALSQGGTISDLVMHKSAQD